MLLSDVWRLSAAYIRRNSRTEKPRNNKICTEIAHVTCDVGYLCANALALVRGEAVGCRGPIAHCLTRDSAMCFRRHHLSLNDFRQRLGLYDGFTKGKLRRKNLFKNSRLQTRFPCFHTSMVATFGYNVIEAYDTIDYRRYSTGIYSFILTVLFDVQSSILIFNLLFRTCNRLPYNIRNIRSHSAFCRQLKTYLFTVPD